MPNLLTAIVDRVDVEYGQFVLQEIPMTRNALEVPVPAGDWLAAGGDGGLLLHSAGTDHRPSVRVELWDAEPHAAAGGWDRVVELRCDLGERVRLQSVTATQSPRVLPITRPGPHHARVHAGGRAETAALDEGTFAEGVEGWLVQLWPA
ncbi:hypothetical protein [Amycolatopsis tolypomycina]|uniref:Uncharacterized protein n=1 Tax=Amycolatopsis tolypomycina TaxID=208445 RepID=A0A1H4XK22_9PSEU|nr:hypothetical protein [Amycolatopsis tolypomycina]SED06032.1 hypothetical protein SAMN04489727_6227 [Amycolatopsis tolypomycina]